LINIIVFTYRYFNGIAILMILL